MDNNNALQRLYVVITYGNSGRSDKLIFRGEELMVKVIKYGQKRRVTCNHCGAVLEFDNNDLETYQVDWNEWEKRIKCPACTETVTVR